MLGFITSTRREWTFLSYVAMVEPSSHHALSCFRFFTSSSNSLSIFVPFQIIQRPSQWRWHRQPGTLRVNQLLHLGAVNRILNRKIESETHLVAANVNDCDAPDDFAAV